MASSKIERRFTDLEQRLTTFEQRLAALETISGQGAALVGSVASGEANRCDLEETDTGAAGIAVSALGRDK